MCKELEDELDKGSAAARDLVEHLCSMGAANCEIPVTRDGIEFRVIVERIACGRNCGHEKPYGFVPEAGCPVHD